MGRLMYGKSIDLAFDDRVLAHLQVVIGAKLRRGESFYLSWSDPGEGRSTVWLDRSMPLVFRYMGGRTPSLNREWLEILTASANSSQGLQVTAEPGTVGER
jgi:hypothetical protein